MHLKSKFCEIRVEPPKYRESRTKKGFKVNLSLRLLYLVLLFFGLVSNSLSQNQENKLIHDAVISSPRQSVNIEIVAKLLKRIKSQPRSETAWLWRALVRLFKNADDSERLSQVLENDDLVDNGSLFAYSYHHYLESRYDLAWDAVSKCLEAGFDEALVINLAGAIESKRGNFSEALVLIDQAITKDPTLTFAQNNMIMAQARLVFRTLEDSHTGANLIVQSEIEKLKSDFAALGRPLEQLFLGTDMYANPKWKIIALENQYQGLVLAKNLVSGSFYSHLYSSGATEPKWEIVQNVGNKIVLLKRSAITGSHHEEVTYFHLDDQGRFGNVTHEWQYMDPASTVDFEKDGIPEIMLDFSDYYVKSFAEGIVDYSFSVLRYDTESGKYIDSPLKIDLPSEIESVQGINALAVSSAYRGDWVYAKKLLKEAMSKSDHLSLKLNYQLVNYHVERFSPKYRDRQTMNSALSGGIDVTSILASGVDWEHFDTKPSILRLFESLVRNEINPSQVKELLIGYFEYREEQATKSNSSTNKKYGEYVWPEVRAFEHALISYVNGYSVYTPPGINPSALVDILSIKGASNARNYISRKIEKNISGSHLKVMHDLGSSYDRIQDIKIERYLKGDYGDEIDVGLVIDRLYSFLLRRDYARAEQLLSNAEVVLSADIRAQPHLKAVGRTIDMRYGRYYKVIQEVRKLHQGGTLEVQSIEAFEKLGLHDIAKDMYIQILNDAAYYTSYSVNASETKAVFESLVGLARVNLDLKELEDAEVLYRLSLESLHNNDHMPMFYSNYSEATLGLAKTLLEQNKTGLARAYNSAAYLAAKRLKPGPGWMQGASQHNLDVLPRVFFNDFLISAQQGKHRQAIAYLSAAISLMLDQYNLTTDAAKRHGLNEVAHQFYRTAVDYYLQRHEYEEAFTVFNSVKQTAESQHLFQKFGLDGNELVITNFQKLRKTAMQSNVVVIQYMLFEDYLAIFIIDEHGELHVEQQPISRHLLTKKIDSLLDNTLELGAETQLNKLKEISQSLYVDLIEPVLPFLSQDMPIVLVPDRELYQLPFGMLMSPEKRYLIQEYVLKYGALLGTKDGNIPKRSSEDNILLVHSAVTPNFKELRYAPEEVMRIANIFKGIKVKQLSLEDANRNNVIKSAENASVIHMAIHSRADAFYPENSLLVLSANESENGSNRIKGADSGISMKDMMNGSLLLKNSPLVVLSSCDSGVGKIYEEGVASLASGLMAAGASTAVVTQWEVLDMWSPDFMASFYNEYRRNSDAAKSLQLAKVEAIKSGLHPQIWAPYVAFEKLSAF